MKYLVFLFALALPALASPQTSDADLKSVQLPPTHIDLQGNVVSFGGSRITINNSNSIGYPLNIVGNGFSSSFDGTNCPYLDASAVQLFLPVILLSAPANVVIKAGTLNATSVDFKGGDGGYFGYGYAVDTFTIADATLLSSLPATITAEGGDNYSTYTSDTHYSSVTINTSGTTLSGISTYAVAGALSDLGGAGAYYTGRASMTVNGSNLTSISATYLKFHEAVAFPTFSGRSSALTFSVTGSNISSITFSSGISMDFPNGTGYGVTADFEIYMSGLALNQTSVNTILVQLDTGWNAYLSSGIGSVSSNISVIDLSGGTSAAPSGTGIDAVNDLASYNWTVITN